MPDIVAGLARQSKRDSTASSQPEDDLNAEDETISRHERLAKGSLRLTPRRGLWEREVLQVAVRDTRIRVGETAVSQACSGSRWHMIEHWSDDPTAVDLGSGAGVRGAPAAA